MVTALSVPFAPLIILALLATLAWTLETLRNVVCASTARRVAAVYLDKPPISGSQSLSTAFSTWFGSICMGSLFVPTLHILRVMVSCMTLNFAFGAFVGMAILKGECHHFHSFCVYGKLV